MDTWTFYVMALGLGAIGISGYAAGTAYACRKYVMNATKTANGARAATAQLADDIDDMDRRFDGIYAELERHEKTFAKSRRSRSERSAEKDPKPINGTGVNDAVMQMTLPGVDA